MIHVSESRLEPAAETDQVKDLLALHRLQELVAQHESRIVQLEASVRAVGHRGREGGEPEALFSKSGAEHWGRGDTAPAERESAFLDAVNAISGGIQTLLEGEKGGDNRTLLLRMQRSCDVLRGCIEALSLRAGQGERWPAPSTSDSHPFEGVALGRSESVEQAPSRNDTSQVEPGPISGPFRHARVLIAEDDVLNMRVIRAALSPLGCDVTSVSSGHEAVACFRNIKHNLVLVDCQMPEIDGYEVARQIRTVDGEWVPIVAVTADASEANRERCLAVGMDDFIAKPFALEDLRNLVEYWLTRYQDEPKLRPGESALDVARLRSITDEAVGMPLAVLAELFIGDAQQRLGKIRSDVEEGATDAVRRQAHALAGAAGNVGAKSVLAVARRLENMDPDCSLEEARNLALMLAEELARADRELQQLIQRGFGA